MSDVVSNPIGSSVEPPSWLADMASAAEQAPPSWLIELAGGNLISADIDSDNWGLIAPRIPDHAAIARLQEQTTHRVSARKMRSLLKLNCMVPCGNETHDVVSASSLVKSGIADSVGNTSTVVPCGEGALVLRGQVAYDRNDEPILGWASASYDNDDFILVSFDRFAGNYDVIVHSPSGHCVELSGKDTKYLSHVFANYDEGRYSKPKRKPSWPKDNETLDQFNKRTNINAMETRVMTIPALIRYLS